MALQFRNTPWCLGAAGAVFVLCAAACIAAPAPGELGKAVYIGNTKGEVPLDVLPPMADRAGNMYVLASFDNGAYVQGYVGQYAGGWTPITPDHYPTGRGDTPLLHGWSGFSQDTAYFWSGDGLYGLVGGAFTGGFAIEILHDNPLTGSVLQHRAVIPYVRDAPSKKSIVSLIQNPGDPLPYWSVLDLNVTRATSFVPFEPRDATALVIAGVGADVPNELGFVVVQYQRGEETRVEGRFIDTDATTVTTVPIANAPALDPYGVSGYLQRGSGGLVAGLLKTGGLITFNQHSGTVRDLPGIEPVGVHLWGGQLYLVGVANGRPALAPIGDDGTLGNMVEWTASEKMAAQLRSPITVIDARALPSRAVRWSAQTATGTFPFLSPHSLTHYADDTTLWTIAGPSFDTGGSKITALGLLPVGISYP